jgi:hypothetical protein
MKCMKAIVLPVLAGWLLMGACGSLRAQAITAETSLSRHLVMAASFVRETQDQEWRLRITGRLPTPPGMYAIVYNEAGDLVCHGAIAAGDYSPETPFTLTVPKDGLAQQYVIKLLGVNANFDAVTLPMTDLPFEVYGGRGDSIFVMPYPARGQIRRLAFQVNPGASNVLFFGAANMSVLDTNGVVLADTRSDKAELAPKSGQTYWLDPGNANQITVKGGEKIYFTFDPERWFYPSITWDLESRPWWKGLRKQ